MKTILKRQTVLTMIVLALGVVVGVWFWIGRQSVEHLAPRPDVVGQIILPNLSIIVPHLGVPLRPTTRQWIVNVPLTPLTSPLWTPPPSLPPLPPAYRSPHLVAPRQQGKCGCCWAFALMDSLTDCVRRTNPTYPSRSVQWLLQCYNQHGCEGGSPEHTAQWLMNTQSVVPSEDQVPFTSSDGNEGGQPRCRPFTQGLGVRAVFSLCVFQEEDRYSRGIINDNVQRMKQALLAIGPVYACMSVTDDLFSYRGLEPYRPQQTEIVGGHAIEIVGWTARNTWLCRCAWENWPLLSPTPQEFEIPLGENVAGIEARSGFALPWVR